MQEHPLTRHHWNDELQSPQYTKYQNKAHDTVQKPDQINLNYICCSRICNDMGSTASSSCPLKHSDLYWGHCVPPRCPALTLARFKTFPLLGPLNIHWLYPCKAKDTDPCPTKPGKHCVIFPWPASSRISQTCCHSLPWPPECPPPLVPAGPETCCIRLVASDCNSTNAPH
jgi:hypothetical protein